ncbi:MAG: UDP-N-acetylmuramate--L-alanine ligase [Negativicutes bacterium]|nr:UDP-N-acetylmuramate--L-alanine ligase [Negativicutes bacterium]
MENLGQYQKVHFVAIGGIGMSALARILLGRGVAVSGSDESESHITEDLRRLGAKVYCGHQAEQLGDAELVVVSSAIKYENAEVEEAGRRGIPIWHRSKLLNVLMAEKESITVAGAHGKTTTSSMLTTVLLSAGQEPAAILGGELAEINGNACWGKGRYLVAEVDESDGSFLNLNYKYAVITNIEADHLDYYPSLCHIEQAFVTYLNQLPADGFAMLGIDSDSVRKIMPQLTCSYLSYGFAADARLQATKVVLQNGHSQFQVVLDHAVLGEIELQVPGRHNVQNALAVVGICLHLGLGMAEIRQGLADFCGAKRRFEKIGSIGEITVIEDYSHHPTEIKAALAAARTYQPKRLVVVFQPHLYSRTRNLRNEFGKAFFDADLVILTDIFASREKRPEPGVDGQMLVEAVREWDPQRQVIYIADKKQLPQRLAPLLRPGDMVIFMGAGDINQFGIPLLQELQNSLSAGGENAKGESK